MRLQCSVILSALFALLITDISAAHALPAFPGARGFGTQTVAGSGRHLTPPRTTVHRITSLADAGAGTLRACVEATGPRTCVFETSGHIQLSNELKVRNPYITIAGQTAPAPGIMISSAAIRIETNDVMIQHLEIRTGDGPGSDPGTRDGISIGTSSSSRAAYNVVLDHLSLSWALDENLSTWYQTTHNVTLSNLIVAEGLENSIHPEGAHSKGLMLGDFTTSISVHGSLLAHNFDRNGYWKPGTTGEFLGNVIYNWGGRSGSNITNLTDHGRVGAPVLLNFVGNLYRPGADSPLLAPLNGRPADILTRVYVQDNLGPTRTADNQSEWLITNMPELNRALLPPVPWSGAPLRSAGEALDHVLNQAGTRPAERNDVDTRIISELVNSRGTIKDCVSGCARSAGGWPARTRNIRTLTLPSNIMGDDDGDGYTNLEDTLHDMAAAVEGNAELPEGNPTPDPTPSPTSTATATRTATPTRTVSPVPTRTSAPTATRTATPTSTLTSTPTRTPVATVTNTPTSIVVTPETPQPQPPAPVIPTQTPDPEETHVVPPLPPSQPTAIATPTPTRREIQRAREEEKRRREHARKVAERKAEAEKKRLAAEKKKAAAKAQRVSLKKANARAKARTRAHVKKLALLQKAAKKKQMRT